MEEKKFDITMLGVAPFYITAKDLELVFENAKAFDLDTIVNKNVSDVLGQTKEGNRNTGMDR